MGRPKPPEEIEVKLAIIGPRPRAILEHIRLTERIGRFRVMFREMQVFDDRYYDTPRGDLTERGFALRVRKEGERRIITLKYPGTADQRGVTRRGEMELPWSLANRRLILRRLEHEGVGLHTQGSRGPNDLPDAPEDAEMVEIQFRRTLRNIFGVTELSEANSDEPYEELCLDETVYHIQGRVVRRYEVEIETRRQSPDVAREVALDLEEMFPSELIPWPYGKLATGREIEALLRTGAAEDAVDGEELTLAGYRRLRASLDSRSNHYGTP